MASLLKLPTVVMPGEESAISMSPRSTRRRVLAGRLNRFDLYRQASSAFWTMPQGNQYLRLELFDLLSEALSDLGRTDEQLLILNLDLTSGLIEERE